jgi:two-component system, sporulation sensor kinase E
MIANAKCFGVFIKVTVKEPHYITVSKRICKESGMDPTDIASPKKYMTTLELAIKRKSYNEILSVISYFSNKLLDFLKGTPLLIIISDSEGFVLDLVGDEDFLSKVHTLGISPGCLFTQEDTGTNVVTLALQQGHPICLIGTDHYHTYLHEVACYGAPFRFTDENCLLGTIGIMTPLSCQNPLFFTMLSQVVESIERELLLRKQNKKLNIWNQILLDRTRNGIVITNEKGITTEFNDFAQQLSNLGRDSAVGKSIYDWDLVGDYFRQVIEKEEKFENEELHVPLENGEPLICLFDAQPIYEGETIIGAFGQFRDITDRYSMEERVRESERQALAGRIAAGIAHEIRNPLTTVRGYLQYLGKDLDESTSLLLTTLLIPEIDRANKIITDFLRIAKPSEPNKEVIGIHYFFVDYLWKFLESESLLYNVNLSINLHPSTKDLSILCNREDLLQVFINMFLNSVQAKGGSPLHITISTKKLESHVQFIFEDNGTGIPPSILNHIFDPFFTTKDEGTGLGLSVSRTIVENYQGTMHASSNANGTKFIIEFPFIR